MHAAARRNALKCNDKQQVSSKFVRRISKLRTCTHVAVRRSQGLKTMDPVMPRQLHVANRQRTKGGPGARLRCHRNAFGRHAPLAVSATSRLQFVQTGIVTSCYKLWRTRQVDSNMYRARSMIVIFASSTVSNKQSVSWSMHFGNMK